MEQIQTRTWYANRIAGVSLEPATVRVWAWHAQVCTHTDSMPHV